MYLCKIKFVLLFDWPETKHVQAKMYLTDECLKIILSPGGSQINWSYQICRLFSYFSICLLQLIAEFDRSPSWFLKASETWRECKMPMGGWETETHAITLQHPSPPAFCTLPKFCSP